MFKGLFSKLLGDKSDRQLKKFSPLVDQINGLESEYQALDDAALMLKTDEFRQRLNQGEQIDSLLPEAFATVREAGRRVLGMRHFDVQLLGGMVLHQGGIAEMKTGEGKTLVATLAVYLNALSGKGVHVITVNDYLAQRDAEWMGTIYRFLGLSVGCIVHGVSDDERKAAYHCDITYGTNNEFGFDYLRDNMKFALEDYVQRPLHYAIVDEVDSILIDEARTPLIISGPSEDSSELYYRVDRVIPRLKQGEVIEHRDGGVGKVIREYTGDFTIDEKARTATLTEQGVSSVEKMLGIDNMYDPRHIALVHHVNQALKAHAIFKNDVDYVVKDGQVIIVDEFTGRLMPGRRWGDGQHQAVEAKEGVKIESENQTLASITFQNFFRMYEKLAGMTGTAETEAEEFGEIYRLNVAVIPTNKAMVRDDMADVIYKTDQEKHQAVIEDIVECNKNGQPVLVGTISIEDSEKFSAMLKKRGVKHHVLNAKHHEQEAEIVAQAGRIGAVTIATNMAGRGTDIVLGGNPEMLAKQKVDPASDPDRYQQCLQDFQQQCEKEKAQVLESGGLYILGTERHESRRIDNQLRGRSGRQGDPGRSRFYLSLEDNLLRIFGSHRVAFVMEKLKLPEGEPIEHKMISRAIENAQKKVEAHNFEIRKHLLEYDDVMNRQREVIYEQRKEVLAGDNIRDMFDGIVEDAIGGMVEVFCPERTPPMDWSWGALREDYKNLFNMDVDVASYDDPKLDPAEVEKVLIEQAQAGMAQREEEFTAPVLDSLMKGLLLHSIDNHWKGHLLAIDHLKEGIGLRSYGQKNPKEEYKREAYALFMDMMGRIRHEVVQKLYHIQLTGEEDVEEFQPEPPKKPVKMTLVGQEEPAKGPQIRKTEKVGRNDPCPCGSGKKYKHCHGK